MALDENEIADDLLAAIQRNPNLEPIFKAGAFKTAWFAAQILLGNGSARVEKHLKMLETELESRLPSTSFFGGTKDVDGAKKYFANSKERATGVSPKNKSYSHLLSQVLTEAEKGHGFTHQSKEWLESARGFDTPPVPYMVTVVSSKVFDTQLLNSQHWKDVGVSARHGEYTHRIQWYVIYKSGAVDAPAKLMSSLAKFGPVPGLLASAAWDALVDRGKVDDTALFKARDANDFRCPEYFNDYLTDDLQRDTFPLLAAFLRARKQKRSSAFYLDEYIAKKLYGKKLNQLTDEERKDVLSRADPNQELGLITKTKG